ncbi:MULTISPECIES: Zn-dependent oxidoreductase [unclassified Escherichia]|uniref:Zn-dependent oxidoreductase n=1 Tax=unclassified Escherichia TaxID=2608889 RepID=UPI001029D59A|nr:MULTISPECIES: Zn-dependent oxidoreductase [unclassified Escherichia]RZN39699.1 Zn-dependent oxidoreductase [Escherichia sp. E10V5]TBR66829.1 Zn-dependent oxidoreductase [Escherichia sp. E10V4]TGB73726.1 Zn-dependent oxidoreductase [Escherichia sp. E4702]TGB93342.1 Zn-dependent oxidoreductase [Escherichia sp. E2748]TGC02586.1 Zn-dependent oxidoreductase [Escherichia sp. E2586]
MVSVVVEKPGQMHLIDSVSSAPKADEVCVKVEYAGICGSDLHIYHGANPFAVYPRIVGHEFVGTITSVGDNISPQRIGERVVVDPVISCGHCYPCSIGRPNVCESLNVLGVHRDGGFTDYTCVPATNIWRVPESIPANLAAAIEPYAVAANVTNRTGVFPTDVALVYGAGPAGLTIIDVLCNVWQIPVIVVDQREDRLLMAGRCGATHTFNNRNGSLREFLHNNKLTPTLIYDAVCHPSILEEAVTLISPAGRIGLLGFSATPSAIAQQELTRRELTLYSSRLNCRMFPTVIEWMVMGLIHPENIISHVFDIQHVHEAFKLIESQQEGLCKVLLKFPES